MKRTVAVLLAAAGLLGLSLANGTASAQSTTDVYVVHGLNLADQSAQSDGGTNVTVCADGADLIPDFEFGQIVGPTAVPSDSAVNIVVYGGAAVDCAAPGGATELINQDVTPSGDAVAVVATSASDVLALTAFPLNAACSEEGNGRLTAAHASGDTPEVEVLVAGSAAGNLSFGGSLNADLPAADYSVQVDLASTPVVGPADIPVNAQANTLVFVVGNIGAGPTPVVPLVGEAALDTCPTTTTTVAPTTTTPGADPAAPPSGQAPVGSQSGGAPLAITG
ncbi:MAG: hypothetical protein ACR2OH_07070 [Microthrixaceae bacterium]